MKYRRGLEPTFRFIDKQINEARTEKDEKERVKKMRAISLLIKEVSRKD